MIYLGLNIAKITKFWIRTNLSCTKYYFWHVFPNFHIIRKTKLLKTISCGKKAFVFANGPSLNKLDPHKILFYKRAGYDIFAVNSYINSEFAKIVNPTHYVFSDPAHFGHNLHLLSEKRRKEVVEDVDKVRSCGAVLYVPIQYYNKMSYPNKYAFCDAENIFNNNITITKPRGYLSMTAYKALAIACYMGYDAIYISGFDNNYFKTISVDQDNLLYYNDIHFYGAPPSGDVRFRVTDEGGSIGELLYSHHFLFKQLEKFSGFPIINLDENSLVDAFSKKHNLDVDID